jgi:hypothetical protein
MSLSRETTTSARVTVPAGVEQDYVDRSIDRIIEAQSRTKDFAPQPNVRHSDLGKLTDGELLHMLFDSEIDPHQAQS